MRVVLLLIPVCLASAAWASEAEDIVRRAVENDLDFFSAARNYTYLRHHTVTEIGKKGDRKTTEDRTEEVLVLYGKPYLRLLQKDGKPLPAKDARKEEKKLNKEAAQRKKNETKIAAAEARDRDEQRKAVQEIYRAFDFQVSGTDRLAGRESWVVDATPRPGYKPNSRQTSIYPKLSGRIWIDKEDYRLVKIAAKVNEKISFGWLLLQLHPGAVFEHERTRMESGTWLPQQDLAKGSAKILGLKTVNAEVVSTYSEYRRFQVESTIRDVAVQNPSPSLDPQPR